MILNVLAATLALLSLNFSTVSTPVNSVESTFVTAQAQMGQQMSQETEITLIEEHAAPHWNLSINEAWTAYFDGTLLIIEVIPEKAYELRYDGGFIEVVLEQGQG